MYRTARSSTAAKAAGARQASSSALVRCSRVIGRLGVHSSAPDRRPELATRLAAKKAIGPIT